MSTLSYTRDRLPGDAYERDSEETRRAVARSLVVADVLSTSALLLVLWLVSASGIASWLWAPSWLPLFVVVTLPMAVGISGLTVGGPTSRADVRETGRIVTCAVIVAFLALLLALFLAPEDVGRGAAGTAILGSFLAVFALIAGRVVIRRRLRVSHPERLLILGAGATGLALAEAVMARRQGVEVVGFVDDSPRERPESLSGIPVFSEALDLNHIAAATGANRLIIAFSQRPAGSVLESVRSTWQGTLPISVVPRYYEITSGHATVSELEGFPLLNVTNARLSLGARFMKRAIDLAVAGGALIVLAPALLILALAIKIDSRGPVMFRQERMGYQGGVFRIFKFRTMHVGSERLRAEMAHLNDMEGAGPLFKMKNDPRVTRVGRVLRRMSLDELPQLLNVIAGSMSLVGPRPFVTHEAAQIEGWGARRLELTPGITGLWQVRGRNDVPFEEMVRLDYLYVTNWSPWWDVRILLETVPKVLSGKGAN